jgi:6-phosphogluconolactonase
MTRLTACQDAETVARRAAAHVALQLRHAYEQRGIAHLALSGGTTPGRTYELLGTTPDDLLGVELWFADERCVGPEDPESNYRLVAETLLAGAAVPPERVHRMHGEAGPEEGARLYADELARHLAGESPSIAPVLDVIVLGIGPDGHVASLFPGAATLDAGANAVCLGVHDSPKPPPERITLSLEVLRAARECVLLATGASKADAVAAMLGEPSRHVPASLLRRERLTVILDDAAAPAGQAGRTGSSS